MPQHYHHGLVLVSLAAVSRRARTGSPATPTRTADPTATKEPVVDTFTPDDLTPVCG